MRECVFDKGKKCVALVTRKCEKCSFRKTKEELIEGRKYAKALLERLPEEQRKAIDDKYHGRDSINYDLQF
jgi:hypothetical protein